MCLDVGIIFIPNGDIFILINDQVKFLGEGFPLNLLYRSLNLGYFFGFDIFSMSDKGKKKMMFLTLGEFLSHFPEKKMTRDQFKKKLKIMYSKPFTLEQAFLTQPFMVQMPNGTRVMRKPVISGKSDYRYQNRDRIIDYLYQMIITHRHYYLAKHYQAYFLFQHPYEDLKWDSSVDLKMPKKMGFTEKDRKFSGNLSLQKNDASRRMIRNLFYLELLKLTEVTNTIKSNVSYWKALDNLYNKLELEDRLFSPSSIKLFLREESNRKTDPNLKPPSRQIPGFKFNPRLNYHNLFYQLQQYQAKASIINPYFIHWCLENLFCGLSTAGCGGSGRGGGRILTPVLSWGSYVAGFMHSEGWNHYVGIDVMPSVCRKVKYLADVYRSQWHAEEEMGEKKKVEIYCQPSEKLAKSGTFLSRYKGYFDLCLICPPYYDMEIYHEGPQSVSTFKTYSAWLEGYWRPTVEMAYKCLRRGGQFAIIMNDYNTLEGGYYPLVKDFTKITQDVGFLYDRFFYLFNRTSPLRVNKKDRTERMAIFTKV